MQSSSLVIIVDDHEPGQLSFHDRFHTVKESLGWATLPVTRTYGSSGRVTVDYATSDGVATAGKDYVAQHGSLVFEDGETEKEIRVKILTDALPEPNENFCVSLSRPGGGASLGKTNMAVVTILDDGSIEEVSALLEKMLATRAAAGGPRTGGFRRQFADALRCEGSVDHLGHEVPPSGASMALHFCSLWWKLVFAAIPPPNYCGGWLSFALSLAAVAVLSAALGDAAGQLGCAVDLPELVTAICILSVGTSLPDLFASRQAVTDGTDADASVGTMTASNSVNVFLGLGLPWAIASVYHAVNGRRFCFPAGALSFSVAIFGGCAVLCLSLLAFRRRFSGGELGGRAHTRWAHVMLLLGLWVGYVLFSAMRALGVGGELRAPVCAGGA